MLGSCMQNWRRQDILGSACRRNLEARGWGSRRRPSCSRRCRRAERGLLELRRVSSFQVLLWMYEKLIDFGCHQSTPTFMQRCRCSSSRRANSKRGAFLPELSSLLIFIKPFLDTYHPSSTGLTKCVSESPNPTRDSIPSASRPKPSGRVTSTSSTAPKYVRSWAFRTSQHNLRLTIFFFPQGITNAQRASRMVLLARTTPLAPENKPSEGLSLFYADIATGKEKGQVTVSPIKKMGGKAVDANSVRFSSTKRTPSLPRLTSHLPAPGLL